MNSAVRPNFGMNENEFSEILQRSQESAIRRFKPDHFVAGQAERTYTPDMLELYRNGEFEGKNEKQVGAFLYKTYTNRLIDGVRRAKVLKTVPLEQLKSFDYSALGDDYSEIDRFIDMNSLQGVLAYIDDEQQRNVLVLNGAGYGYPDIAAALEMNPMTVGTKLHRARKFLADKVKKIALGD
jgi:RNA polymerase sigma factor (sigma-70 family)